MILRSKDVVNELAPHYEWVGAAIAAAAAAASAAQQAEQQARQRRAAANAAQATKQGSAAGGQAAPNVAAGMLGSLNNPESVKAVQGMVQSAVKPTSASAEAALPMAQPGQQPMPSLQQGQSLQDYMNGQDWTKMYPPQGGGF